MSKKYSTSNSSRPQTHGQIVMAEIHKTITAGNGYVTSRRDTVYSKCQTLLRKTEVGLYETFIDHITILLYARGVCASSECDEKTKKI